MSGMQTIKAIASTQKHSEIENANKVSEKAAKVIGSDPVNVQKKVDENKGTPMKDKQ